MSGQAAFDKLVRPAAMYRGVTTGSEKAGWSEEAERDGMSMRKETRLTAKRS